MDAITCRFSDYTLNTKYLLIIGAINDSTIYDASLISSEEKIIEHQLLNCKNQTIVYFSTCSILDNTVAYSPYVLHKIRIEKLIKESGKKFNIFRLPQVVGISNAKNGFLDFLLDAAFNSKDIKLWRNAKRNIIDIDDVHSIITCILSRNLYLNEIINIASDRSVAVTKLLQVVESCTAKKINYELIDKGQTYEINVDKIKNIILELGIDFGESYIPKIINKYQPLNYNNKKLISIIIPTYNEEHGIEEFYRRTKSILNAIEPRFNHEMIFINDCSTDGTFVKLQNIASLDKNVKIINFSRNFGNQIAITAGIDYAKGHLAIIIDDDLQDPPEIMLNFISKWDNGYKVVYGVRPKRQGINPIFAFIAKNYYRVLNNLSEIDIPKDTGDFRLIDRVVMDSLKGMKEENRYYRGMVAWVGFPQIGVIYERDKRFSGSSTFSLKKYINFAFNGLTSFSDKPLYFSSIAGILITFISFLLTVFLIIEKIVSPQYTIEGWTSLAVIVLFFGGIQLLSIGIVGIYISKIYKEVKNRPLYFIQDTKNL